MASCRLPKHRPSARFLLLASLLVVLTLLAWISGSVFRDIVARQEEHDARSYRQFAHDSSALFVAQDLSSAHHRSRDEFEASAWPIREHSHAVDQEWNRNSRITSREASIPVTEFTEGSAVLPLVRNQNSAAGSTQEEESSGDSQLHIPAYDFNETARRERDSSAFGDENHSSRFESSGLPLEDAVSAMRNAASEMPDEPYQNEALFKEHYKEMMLKLKIFVYPHSHSEPYSNIFLPVGTEHGGNYASEGSFKNALMNSSFITKNASEANLFYLPFSITRLRNDKRVGVNGLATFISSYVNNIRQKWPYWNRTAGADHFFVSCHSITKVVSDKVVYLRTNAIQVVCSSNSFMQGYTPHKDVSLPQVWLRKGTPPEAKLVKQRKVLAFFAGSANSPVRAAVVKEWSDDQDILVYSERLSTPYSKALLTSKFCLHVKGFEVNTARIADAMHFGCVPVILANYYDLPYANALNWDHFSVVVSTLDIPLLKKILEGITAETYEILQKNVMKVRKHFQWNNPPLEYDAFYMVMYELWSERRVLRATF